MNFDLSPEALLFFTAETWETLRLFFDKGGNVVVVIALVAGILWTLIFERVWYYRHTLPRLNDERVQNWQQRADRSSWRARQLRRTILSETGRRIDANLSMIRVLIAVCPLLGLLGTVTGMIEVFHVLAVTGGGDAKAMAGGVSRATIPTMTGMVIALSGIFANIWLSRVSVQEKELLAGRMTVD